METSDKHLQELKEIRDLMEKSSRFLSLSGLSGISAGMFAMAGAVVAWIFFYPVGIRYVDYCVPLGKAGDIKALRFLITDAVLVLLLAISFGFYFSFRKSRKMQIPFWNPASKRLLVNLSIPLVTGGMVSLILLFQQGTTLIAPIMLIFYGLALINAGKYTQYNINYLGITEILTGLIGMIFIKYGFFFWVLGFGVWHILYGSFFYFKYEWNVRP